MAYRRRLHEANVAVNMAEREQHPSVLNMRRERATTNGLSRSELNARARVIGHHYERLSQFLPFLARFSPVNLVPVPQNVRSRWCTFRTCVIGP